MANDDAIGLIGDLLADQKFREAFVENSDKALDDHKLKNKIDAPVLKALKKLSVDQLAEMANVGKALREVSASGGAALRMV